MWLAASLLAHAGESCPGAAEWTSRHPAMPTESSPAPSNPELLSALEARVERDQAARKKWLANQNDEALASAVDAIDVDNVAWLRAEVADRGFPTVAAAGRRGVHLAWVLLQHADRDPQLQSDLLPVIERRFADGELDANDLARLTDRLLQREDKPQRFGTQFDWFAGDFKLPEKAELAKIDAERKSLGLMPLADYVCTLRQAREKNR
ncbi:MAG TPA: DUF6624 domain-containing protein [Steroidobacteraceae bacterium]|nr:DUF6624 domain-containing protein [Steroidobacteraceae bacterium]